MVDFKNMSEEENNENGKKNIPKYQKRLKTEKMN